MITFNIFSLQILCLEINRHCTSTDRTTHRSPKNRNKQTRRYPTKPWPHAPIHHQIKKNNSMAVQLVVSTLCKYRLTSLKQVTRLCKKQQLLYKPRNNTDLKCLHTPVVFLMEHYRKENIHLCGHSTCNWSNWAELKTVCVSLFHSSLSMSAFFLLGPYVCSTQQHYCPNVQPRLQVDRCSYVKCCSRLRRRRRLQRIAGSSLATTSGSLVLQRRVNVTTVRAVPCICEQIILFHTVI